MAVITSSSFAKALWPGINAWYGKEYDEFPVEYTKLFDTYSSKKAFEEDVGVSGFGQLKIKEEGAPIEFDSERQSFIHRTTHVVYALGFIITREIMDDDQYDVVGQRKAQSLAFSARQTKETVGANVYNRATNASFTGGDGVVLLSSAHPNFAGGTQSNKLATAADLSEAALEQAVIDIEGWTNDRGLKIAIKPKTLIIPKEVQFEAYRILNSTLRVDTANNDPNAIKNMGLIPETVVNHYLTDVDQWFIRTSAKHGMKYWERDGDEFTVDNDWDTENAKFKCRGRYSFSWTDWRGIFGSEGA